MPSITRSRKIAFLLFLACAAIVGVLMFYAVNLFKPMFLARDLSEDEVYAVASTRIFFGVLVAYEVKETIRGIIKDVALTPSLEYPHYASRHGLNPDQSWTTHVLFISDDRNATIGEVWVQWDGFMYEMSVYPSRPYSMLYPRYDVNITRTAATTFKSDWRDQDFEAATAHFLEFMQTGDLVWSQED